VAAAQAPTTPAPLVSTNAAQPKTAPSAGSVADAPQPTREESALRERIQRRLSQEKRLSYTAQHVRLEVKQSDVTVQGEVRTAREKQDVAQIIESIAGVRRVNNQLAVINQTNPGTANGPLTP
jgi:osmotically-inducible protein OsmY